MNKASGLFTALVITAGITLSLFGEGQGKRWTPEMLKKRLSKIDKWMKDNKGISSAGKKEVRIMPFANKFKPLTKELQRVQINTDTTDTDGDNVPDHTDYYPNNKSYSEKVKVRVGMVTEMGSSRSAVVKIIHKGQASDDFYVKEGYKVPDPNSGPNITPVIVIIKINALKKKVIVADLRGGKRVKGSERTYKAEIER